MSRKNKNQKINRFSADAEALYYKHASNYQTIHSMFHKDPACCKPCVDTLEDITIEY